MFKVPLRRALACLGLPSLARALSLACMCWIAALAPAPCQADPGQATEDADHATSTRGVVNLNSASADELVRLPGIGPARAAAILELRARIKRFTRVEELLRVKGIGRATFRKLRPLLSLDGPTTLRERG